MPTLEAIRAQARTLLIEYALTSTTSSRALIQGTHSRPTSRSPSGAREHPAEQWAVELERAADSELERLVEQLRAELEQARRRPLAELHSESLDELETLILDRGIGWAAHDVAVALRTSERIVRRVRVVAGRDAERGRLVELNGQATRLERALELVTIGGLSQRAAAATGVKRSTLQGRMRT